MPVPQNSSNLVYRMLTSSSCDLLKQWSVAELKDALGTQWALFPRAGQGQPERIPDKKLARQTSARISSIIAATKNHRMRNS
jgi:hypothetical protein